MNNYHAWKVDHKDFYKLKNNQERLQFLVRFAVLAPSSHNTQPWKFVVYDNEILLSPDFSRALPKSDSNHRQLFISLGCTLENIIIAADYYNLETQIENSSGEGNAMRILFNEKEAVNNPNNNHLIFSIAKRQTSRGKYERKLPDNNFLELIKKIASEGVLIDVVSDEQKKNAIADLVIYAGITAMNSHEFRSELSNYIKSNITKSPLGMPGFTLGIPTPVSFIMSKAIKHFNLSKLSKKQDEDLLKKFTPLFGIISTKRDGKKDWIEAGRMYERIALESEKHKVKTAPLAAVVQTGNFYQDLQKIIGTAFRPQVFFRMGYCEKTFHNSPRLSADEVIK